MDEWLCSNGHIHVLRVFGSIVVTDLCDSMLSKIEMASSSSHTSFDLFKDQMRIRA